ncbi:MAG: T9SS type A sorting domain-containing protein [Flavobacteriales bacterium]
MKKFVLHAIVLLTSIIGQAQLVTLVDPINAFYGSTSVVGEELHSHWDIINASQNTVGLGCRRMILQPVAGATHQFCWGELCSPWGTADIVSSEVVTLASGATTATFFGKYRHNGFAGQSRVRFCWFDSANPTDEFCYDVNYCVDVAECVLGIDEMQNAAEMHIQSNPIQHTGFIQYAFKSFPNDGLMTIWNGFGQMIKQIKLSSQSGLVLISADELSNGVYICQIANEGNVLSTQRFVVSK